MLLFVPVDVILRTACLAGEICDTPPAGDELEIPPLVGAEAAATVITAALDCLIACIILDK